MKTIKCRPILVESKETASTRPFSVGITLCNDKKLRIGNPVGKSESRMKLILISLENDNIEVGDMIYNKFNNSTFNHIHIQSTKHTDISDKKVIAFQSQIPMTYIHQFIEEYNINSVKDVEIEMENYWEDYHGVETTIEKDFCYNKNRPKLNNGFITIVNERLFNQSGIDKLGIKLSDINSSEEDILYTEEEAKDLCKKILWDYIKGIVMVKNSDFDDKLISSINYCEKTNINTWFEQNKKK